MVLEDDKAAVLSFCPEFGSDSIVKRFIPHYNQTHHTTPFRTKHTPPHHTKHTPPHHNPPHPTSGPPHLLLARTQEDTGHSSFRKTPRPGLRLPQDEACMGALHSRLVLSVDFQQIKNPFTSTCFGTLISFSVLEMKLRR